MHIADSLFMRGASAFSFRARSSGQLSQIHCKPFKETWITLSKLWLQSVCDGGVLWLHAETRNRPHKGILIPKFCCSWSELEFRHSEILSYRTHNCRLSSIAPITYWDPLSQGEQSPISRMRSVMSWGVAQPSNPQIRIKHH